MSRRLLGGATLALACLAVSAAHAADAAASVSIPIGDWLGALLTSVETLVVGLVGWVVAKWAPAVVKPILTEQLLARAVDYALAAVEGAAKGKVLTIPVTNQVIATAAEYAVANAPGLAKWLGDTLEPKIIARLSSAGVVPADASAASLGVSS